MQAPALDSLVTVISDGGWTFFQMNEPGIMPVTPVIKLKDQLMIEGSHYTLAGGKIIWLKAISIFADITIYDGITWLWTWSASEGEYPSPE